MDYIEALKTRFSVKKFEKGKKVSPEILNRILLAGKLSASSQGMQPYEILVVESESMLEKVTPAFYNPSQISTCSHLLVLVIKKDLDEDYIARYFSHIAETREIPVENLTGFKNSITGFVSKMSTTDTEHWAEKQAYIVLGNLLFAAALEKVDSAPIEGFDPEKLADFLSLNKEKEKATVCLTLGYAAQDDITRTWKKVRKPDEKLFKFI